MWGFNSARNRNLANQIFQVIIDKSISANFNANLQSPKGQDQFFLTQYVYPSLRQNSIIHDSYLCMAYGGDAFPTKRQGNCYVGSPSDCNATAIFIECPLKCRPKEHQDWKEC